eukprot:6473656-Amphidinium_carterae.4
MEDAAQEEACGGQSNSDGGSRTMGALARAGPSADWEKLELVKGLEDLGQTLRQAKSKAAIDEIFEESKPQRTVLTALVIACKASVSDLKGARAAKRKAEEKKEKEGVKKAKGADGKEVLPKPGQAKRFILSHAASQIAVADMSELGGSLPQVAANQQWLVDWARTHDAASKEINDFAAQYLSSARRLTQGRGQRMFLDEALVSNAISLMNEKLGKDNMRAIDSTGLDHAKDGIQKFVHPCLYAHTAAAEAVPGLEKKLLPTLRVALRGVREVRVLKGWELSKFLSESSVTQKRTVEEWLETASTKEVESYIHAGNSLWKASLGPGDVLYTPGAYMVGQRAGNSEDHVGMRLVVSPQPVHLEAALKCGQGITCAETDMLEALIDIAKPLFTGGPWGRNVYLSLI